MRNPVVIDAMPATPMTEGLAESQAALMAQNRGCFHTSADDSLVNAYVSRNKRLPVGKHSLIEAWTDEVNGSMAAHQSMSPISAGKQRNNKIEHVKYTPPGRPDRDKGFRRIPKPLHMRRGNSEAAGKPSKKGVKSDGVNNTMDKFSENQLRQDRTKLTNHVNVVSQHYSDERKQLAKMEKKELSFPKSSDSISGENHSSPGEKFEESVDKDLHSMHQHNGQNLKMAIPVIEEHPNEGDEPSAKATHVQVPPIKPPSPHCISDIGSDLNGSSRTQLGHRTTSNRLLNMISIDDAFRQHRGTLASTSPWMAPKLVEREVMNSTYREDGEESQAIANHQPRIQVSGQGMDRSHTVSPYSPQITAIEGTLEGYRPPRDGHMYLESVTDYHNEAVLRGFENLERATEATNNTAYKGLYKFDESCQQPLNLSKGTKRFNRMNRNLQEMVEAFHLHGTPLSRKIQRRKNGQDTKSTVNGGSRPTSGSSTSVASYKFTSTPKFKVGKNRAMSSSPENSTTEDGRESFLEMIMDMDQKKAKGPKDASLNTHLLV